jgi:hypothetical protein
MDLDDDTFVSAEVKDGPGPVFVAGYESECSEEGDWIEPGDSIRADGHGGFAHASCLRMAKRPVIWE